MSTAAIHPMPSMKRVVPLAAIVLTLTIAGSFWIYIQGTQALRAQAQAQGALLFSEGAEASRSAAAPSPASVQNLLKELDGWAHHVTLATGATGGALVLALVLGFAWWRNAWVTDLRRAVPAGTAPDPEALERDFTAPDEEEAAPDLARGLEQQTAERKRLEAELHKLNSELEKRVEERTAVLTKTYLQLEEELNARKQTERALAQQAQELERSKDVLELHVQARTQEIQKLKSRYEQVLNSAGEGIYGLDLNGKTTFVNPAAAKITGWKVEELVGKLENEVFQRSDANGAGGKEHDGEHLADVVFHRKDGSSFPVEYVRTPILEKDRKVGAVVLFKDITERKRTDEALARKAAELARSNSELEQFAYVASHDLQEPLRKIQAFGDRLKTKCDAVDLKEGRDYLERMQSAAARMQTLINDLLTFSRVISTTQPFVPVDLGTVTKEVLTDLEVRIEQTKAKVEVGSLPTIDADPLQMRQLLQNLVGNALKFQPPDAAPVVRINGRVIKTPFAGGTDIEHEQCELTIQDNGIGFDEKYSDKIFAVFQRLHGRTEYEGTGVGLAVCRRITDRHGGTIVAKSKPGEGATFIVTMPVRHVKKETPHEQPK